MRRKKRLSRSIPWPFLFGCLILCALARAEVSDLHATHQAGQTFLTWTEAEDDSGAQYALYRSAEPIQSVTGAELLGVVGANSARDPRASAARRSCGREIRCV